MQKGCQVFDRDKKSPQARGSGVLTRIPFDRWGRPGPFAPAFSEMSKATRDADAMQRLQRQAARMVDLCWEIRLRQ
jgi:hypothetical protein